MARIPITLMGYRCERCSHEWLPRGETKGEPKLCPSCKSLNWDKPSKSLTTYEQFSRLVRNALEDGSSLTWTEIRTAAQLPQAFPNNQWVHRLERDIGLERLKQHDGIIKWKLQEPEVVTTLEITKSPKKRARSK